MKQLRSPTDVCSVALTAKLFWEIASEEALWRHFFLRSKYAARTAHSVAFSKSRQKGITWKESYKRFYDIERRWKSGHYKTIPCYDHRATIWAVTCNKRHALCATQDATVCVWDLSKARRGRLCSVLLGHSLHVKAVQLTSNSKVAFSGGGDNTIRMWDPLAKGQNGKQCLQTMVGHSRAVWSLSLNERHQQLASGSGDATIRLWDVEHGRAIQTFEGHEELVSCVYLRGHRLVSGSDDKTVKIWDTRSRSAVRTLNGHSHYLTCCQFDRDKIVTGGLDGTIRFWDWRSDGGSYRVDRPFPKIRDLRFDKLRLVCSGGSSAGMKVMDVETGEEWCCIGDAEYSNSWALDFNDDVLVGGDSIFCIWDFSVDN
ncbi:putative serine/threonine-protein kinase PkwA [Balamuthia mandrillaris]